MFRRLKPLRSPCAFLTALATILALAPVPLVAQEDDWEVIGDADGVTLGQDEDDYLDGDAEISLTVEWTHLDEERGVLTQLTTTASIDHNWDVSGTTLGGLGLGQMLRAVECDDGDFIFINARLIESDMLGGFETVLATVAGVAVGITVATLLAPSGPGAAAGGLLAAKVAGGAAGALSGALFKYLGSGIEDLGKVKAKKLALGPNAFTLAGGGGGGTINIADNSVQSPNVLLECVAGRGSSAPMPVDPNAAIAGIFPEILNGLLLAPGLNREDSTGPGADTEMRQLRLATSETLASLAEVAAVYFVYQAQEGFAGASGALPLLASGRLAYAAGDYDQAVADYRNAFDAAYSAIWTGTLGTPYTMANHLTLFAPTRLVSPDTVQEFTGWAQGLSSTEFVDAVDVTGQSAGMEFDAMPGVARTGVLLAGDIPPDFQADTVLGLGRISGGVIRSPDGTCAVEHYEEGTIGAGVFIDEQGPFFEPDADGCGYGQVIATYQDVENGGVPVGAGPDPDHMFTLTLNLDSALQPGEYDLTVAAQIQDSMGGATREITAPLRLLVPHIGEIFSNGFEEGSTAAWQ